MDIDEHKQLKDDYLNSLRKSSIEISNGVQAQVQEFLYTIILNKQYDTLIQKYNDLNKDICQVIIYGHNFPSTTSAMNILNAFVYFYIGSQVKIDDLLERSDGDSPWDSFFNMCLYFIEGNLNGQRLYKDKFEQILKLSNKAHLALDTRASENKLQNLRNANQIVDFFIHAVYKELSQADKNKKKHFAESFKFLQNHNMIQEIHDKTKKLKIEIINAYITQDYSYLRDVKLEDKNSLVIITYSLIQIDYKQFSVFLGRCNDKDRNYHIQQIKNHVDAVERDYFKLVLVGRSLKKICDWERTIDLYEELIKSSEKIQSKQKYNVFLYYTVSKMKFLKGETKQASETCKQALDEIDKFSKQKQLFYQPKMSRFVQMELLFMNLVLRYILKDNKQKIKIIDQIKEKQKVSDDNNLKRNLNILYQLFVEEIQERDISKVQDAEYTFKTIRKFVEGQIEQRQSYVQNQKGGFLGLGASQILDQNKKHEIKQKTQCLLQLFIITQFLRKQDKDFEMVYYLNAEYIPIFLEMITLKELAIEPVIQAKIYRFFGKYDLCFNIAQSINNYKLMAEKYFAEMNDAKALEYYEKVQDEESHFILGYLYQTKSDREQDQDIKEIYYQKAISEFQQAKRFKKYNRVIRNRLRTISFQKEIEQDQVEIPEVMQSIILQPDSSYTVSTIVPYLQQQQDQQNQQDQFDQVDTSIIFSRKSTLDDSRSSINSQPMRSNSTTISLNFSNFKGRADIGFFYKEVRNDIAPFYTKLIPHIEKFLYSTQRYELESKVLIDGMKIYEVIGKGAYGRVNRVIFEDKQYASKISSVSFNSMTQEYPEQQLKYLCLRINEINILNEIQDYKIPYVIQNKHLGFKFALLNKQGLKSIKIFNLSPIYKPFSIIQAQGDKEKRIFAEKIAICLKQLQMKRISHQDIKPENVLVDDNNDPVLIDFGISISNFRSTLNGSNLFTQLYADPELEKSGQKSRKNDVYSFGITLYDLFVCKRPFHDAIYHYDIEFLAHETHQKEINNIKLPEIQQLIYNCTQSNSAKRFSLSQVLYQFLLMRPCRTDVKKLLQAFTRDFQDVDISEQEYELITEFQEISQKIPQMDTQQIQHVQQINDTFYRCQYQDNQALLFHKNLIVLQNKQIAFRQILQYMRFVRNLVHLNRMNVDNVAEFYNYRLILQEDGQEKSIQFDIFCFDNGYQPGLIKTQQQLVILLKTIEQMNENGIYMMALANEFLQFQNDVPIITNCLFSFRNQDDLMKNQFGLVYINMVQQNFSMMGIKNYQFDCLKYFLAQIIINMKTKSTLRKSAKKKTQFEENLEHIINNIETFERMHDIITIINTPENPENPQIEDEQK